MPRMYAVRFFRSAVVPAVMFGGLFWGGSALIAQSQSTMPSSAVARITQPVDERSLVTLRGNTHPLAQARYDRGLAPASLPAARMLLVLKRSDQQEADLKSYLADVQTEGSPNYHKFLTPEQFGALYGAADADVQTVSTWLQGHGFSVNKVDKAKTVVEFSGSAAQLQEAFHTEIHSYVVNGEQHYANASDPRIPAALAPVVVGVAHMNNFAPRAHAVPGPRGQFDPATRRFQASLTLGSGTNRSLYVGPSDAATIYDSPITSLNKNFSGGATYDGTGVTIGVAGDANIDPTGVANYRSFFGLSASAPTIVVDGDDPGVGDIYTSDSGEALLDVEIAGGMAPGAKIILYTSAGSALDFGLDLAIRRALDDNVVSILNVSFGSCEAAQGTSGNALIYNNWEQAAAQGITVTVSTGDSGAAGCDDPNTENVAQGGLQVNGLASTPFNIAVGGTDFDVLRSNFSSYVNSTNTSPYEGTALRYIPEEPWNNSTTSNGLLSANSVHRDSSGNTNIVAAGGGASSCVQINSAGTTCLGGYAKPSWQKLFDNGDGVRDLPDVSMFASNGFYGAVWAICATGTEAGNSVDDCQVSGGAISSVTGFGGTSAAAPAFAGALAIVSQRVGGRLGQANQVLYPLAKKTPSIFHDVTSGNISVPCTGGSAANCGSNGFLTGYNAASGYDLASGLGSVDITALEAGWSSVTMAASSTALTLDGATSPLTITHGTAVSAAVKVTGSGTPTGDIALVSNPAVTPDKGSIDSPLTLSSGSVSASPVYLPGGTYNVVAHYEGDGSNAASDSNAVPVVVTAENSKLSITPTAYDAKTGNSLASGSIPYGSYTAIDVKPQGSVNANDGFATGSVAFSGGGVAGQSHSINSNGYAELLSTLVPPGSQTFAASYSGDSSFNASTGSVSVTVAQAPTSTAESATASSLSSTGTDVINVTVSTDSAGAVPTGTITLRSGSTALGTSPVTGQLVSGGIGGLNTATAAVTVSGSSLAVGANSITATYSGDANYAGSTSPGVTLTVTGGGGGSSSFALSGNAIAFTHGATTGNTSTISVTPAGGYTGTVDMSCAISSSPTGAQDLPSCSITPTVVISGTTAGTATLTISSTATTGALSFPVNSPFNHGGWYAAGGTALACAVMFGIPARRRAWRAMMAVVLFAGFASIAIGCGGGSTNATKTGTTPGAYVVTVTGVDSATSTVKATTTINLTIN
jgi:trimeric autotransporter adhesin